MYLFFNSFRTFTILNYSSMTLKGICITLVFFLFLFSVSAQKQKQASSVPTGSNHRCGTQTVMDELIKKYPSLKKEMEQNRQKTLQAFQQIKIAQRTNATYTIPVVVHIILSNPATVTDAQVQSQIDVLNEDFAGLNADSTRIPAAFKPFFGKSNIRFCLAKRDTKGDATNGIVRITSSTISSPGINDPVKYTCKGGSDAWDATKYLNIWVCQMPSGFMGYSFYASDPLSVIPLNERGFVNSYRSFGRGVFAQAPFNLGRTATHEIGHFFDLVHIWGPNNCDDTQSCSDDDGIDDTPKQFKCTYGSPAADSVIKDACTGTAPGIMWMNYQDYVDDRAMVMYTPQQYNLMNAAIAANSWMQSLVASDGCTPVPTLNRDTRFEKFNDPSLSVCGNASSIVYTCSNLYIPIIQIKNNGSEIITSLTITAKFATGTPVITNWTGSLPPQFTINITLNAMPLSSGTNSNLVVYTSNPNGSVDQKPANDTGRLGGVIFPLVSTPYTEGFESPAFPPANWQLTNPDGDITWERTTKAAKTGNASMFINNFEYTVNGAIDQMVSPLIPAKVKDSVFLTFQVAAATYNVPDLANNPTDTLEVLVTTDCGLTYTSVYKKWGLKLVTTGNIGVDTSYVPIASQWRRDTAFLGDFSNYTGDNIQAIIRNTANYENNIYIDDINIWAKSANPNLKRKGIMITPNPFRESFVLQYYQMPLNIEYINIYNHIGQLVWQKKIALGTPGNNFGPNYMEVNLSGLSSGIYTVQIVYRDKNRDTIKVLKIN